MTSAYSYLYKLYKLLLVQSYTEEIELEGKYIIPKEVLRVQKTGGSCVICKSSNDLRNLNETSTCDGKSENYLEMISSCFHIKVVDEHRSGEICESCVSRLRDALSFRKQVEDADESLDQIKAYRDKSIQDLKKKANISKVSLDSITQSDYDNFYSFFDHEPLEDGLENTEEKETPREKVWVSQKPFRKPDGFGIPTLDPSSGKCPVCHEVYKDPKDLSMHYESHMPKYLCAVCGKIYFKKTSYMAHMESHEEQRFPCKLCDKTYATKNGVKQHTATYHQKKFLYKCHKCRERFNSNYAKLEHLFVAHGVWYDRHPCSICQKNFYSAYRLNVHKRRIHLKERNVPCTECDGMFFSKGSLALHMVSHFDVRNFPCEHCGKAFKTSRNLAEHLKIHNNIRNHKCELCGQAFVQTTSLKVHIRSHHNLNSPKTKKGGRRSQSKD